MLILSAHKPEQLEMVRQLFVEYRDSLGHDLCFQKFNEELGNLPGRYASPKGRLLLAMDRTQAAGCAGMREIGARICEMYRLFVRPVFRRQGVGRVLAQTIISAAREIGYDRMRLDTLGSMDAAISLYESLGFHRIEPYYPNPIPGAVFMELSLRQTRIV